MRIDSMDTFVCNAYRTNWVFVRIRTDDGIHGWGEATLEYRELTVKQAVEELAREIIGKDAHAIEALWHAAYRDTYFRGGPVYMSALSAVEMALWDIKGKALGVPVWQMLGGKVRETVPCYANGWFAGAKTPEEFAAKAHETVAAGFTGLKWDPFGSVYMTISKAELRTACRCIEAVINAVGQEVDILIEGHGRFNVPTAVRVATVLEDYGITWFEEPVPPDNLDALADVKRRARVPIAAGERLYSRWEYQRFFDLRCADFVQPDVSHVGGIGEMKKIAAQAEALHLAVCPHNPSGPVAMAASLQFAACTTNCTVLETMATDVPHRAEIAHETIRLVHGSLTIPEAPGLGVDLDEAAMALHPFKPVSLRHYQGTLTDIRPSNAAAYIRNADKE